MTRWRSIVIHHSASEWGCAPIIRRWHIERGWKDIGYHFVVLNGRPTADWPVEVARSSVLDGSIEVGRPIDSDVWAENNEIGAHTLGFNFDSLGICVIGSGGIFTRKQGLSIAGLVMYLAVRMQIAADNIVGHYERDQKKPLCPGFDMRYLRMVLGLQITPDDFAEMLAGGKIGLRQGGMR